MAFFDKLRKKEKQENKPEEKESSTERELSMKEKATSTAPKERPIDSEEETVGKEDTESKGVKATSTAPKEKSEKKITKKEDMESKKMEAKKTAAKKPAGKDSSSNKVWHITKRDEDGKWQIKAEGAAKATKLFNTKAEAEEYVKTLKSNNEGSRVVKHKKTGEFQKK